MPLIKNKFSRCLPDSAVARFKEIILITFKHVLSADITNKFFKNPCSTEIDHLVDSSGLLVVPKVSKSRVAARAFSYQAPLMWNHLPLSVREADTIFMFKSRVKTFLYDKAYS